MNRTDILAWRLTFSLLMILAIGLPGCGLTRPTQEQAFLQQRHTADREYYLNQTQDRYVALLQRTKAHYDEYSAGQRPKAPASDYLIVSGGGDWGAFGAGFLPSGRASPPTC